MLDALVTEYLRVLAGERGASVHTLRAYGRELHGFAAWIAGRQGRSRAWTALSTPTSAPFWARSTTRIGQSLGSAGAGRHSQLVQVAGAGWTRERNAASLVATPKLPKHLPRVPSIEQMNRVVESVDDDASSWPRGTRRS